MRIIPLLLSLIFTAFSTQAAPAPRRFGLGLEVGTFAAVTGKYWVERAQAIDFGLSLGFDAWTLIYGDYLWHRPLAREVAGFIGAGGGIALQRTGKSCGRWSCSTRNGATAVIGRMPLGAEWRPATEPFGVFGELVPTLLIGQDISIGIDVGVGGRYYF